MERLQKNSTEAFLKDLRLKEILLESQLSSIQRIRRELTKNTQQPYLPGLEPHRTAWISEWNGLMQGKAQREQK